MAIRVKTYTHKDDKTTISQYARIAGMLAAVGLIVAGGIIWIAAEKIVGWMGGWYQEFKPGRRDYP